MQLRVNFCVIQIIVICCVHISGHDLYVGDDFGSRMSYVEVKKQGLIFFKRHKTEELIYPKGTNITGIACLDLSPDKKGTVAIVDGGLYCNYVKIDLESETGAGLKYIIEIYTSSAKVWHQNPEDVVQVLQPERT